MKNVFLFMLLFLGVSLFWSCDKDDPAPPDTIESFDDGVFITCEGGFGLGNASIYFLDPQKMRYVPEIYHAVNQESVGDVLQSIDFHDDKAYLVVNNSGKISQVNKKTFLKTGAILGLSAPTEIDIEDGKGYIGSLYSQHILVADMSNLTITDSLYVGEQSNRIFEDDNRLWILSQSDYQGRTKDHIYYINLFDSSLDSIKVGSNPLDWAYNDNDQLFVYCQGVESGDGPAIYSIGTGALAVDQKIDVNAPRGFYSKIVYDEYQNRILIRLADGIYTFKPGDQNVSDSPLVSLGDVKNMYGLGVSPENGDIYVGDARDFSSAGMVYIYTGDGQPQSSLQVGVGPNHFYFE